MPLSTWDMLNSVWINSLRWSKVTSSSRSCKILHELYYDFGEKTRNIYCCENLRLWEKRGVLEIREQGLNTGWSSHNASQGIASFCEMRKQFLIREVNAAWPSASKWCAEISAKCSLLESRGKPYILKQMKYLTKTEIKADNGKVCQGCPERKHFYHAVESNRKFCTFIK